MARKPLVVGNWKMHGTAGFCTALAREVADAARRNPAVDLGIAPPFTALAAVREVLRGSTVALAAQNVSDQPQGAFTGEISTAMLADAGCSMVLLGHSERRHVFGEPDELVGRKVKAALGNDLVPLLCVGEKLEEREAGKTLEVVRRQFEAGTAGLAAAGVGRGVGVGAGEVQLGAGRDDGRGARVLGGGRGQVAAGAGQLGQDDRIDHERGGEDRGEFGEERARAAAAEDGLARAAEGAAHSASAAGLKQHDQDEEQAQQNVDDGENDLQNPKHDGYLFPAATMPAKSAPLSDAPPTRNPSTSRWANSPAALSGLTLPPYRMRTTALDPGAFASRTSRRNACTCCASSGCATLPVPIAHTGS